MILILTNLLLLVAQVGSSTAASAAQSTTGPKVIIHVHSSTLCTALRHNVLPALDSLHLNDAMIDKGHALLVNIAKDAAAYAASASPIDTTGGDPFAQQAGANEGSASATGGGSAASEMDAFRVGMLVQNLAKNLDTVEALLSDPHRFPEAPTNEDDRALALAKSRLEAVVARQRTSLNIISGTAETNAVGDLKSRRDVIPYEHCGSCSQTKPYTPMSAPDALASATNQTEQTETGVAPALAPIVEACR
jgi:hypothetical protein